MARPHSCGGSVTWAIREMGRACSGCGSGATTNVDAGTGFE